MIRDIRDSLYKFREAWVSGERSIAYARGHKIGYAVPLRDTMFGRPWAWVAYGLDDERYGIYATLPKAKSRIYIATVFTTADGRQIQMSHPSTGVV